MASGAGAGLLGGALAGLIEALSVLADGGAMDSVVLVWAPLVGGLAGLLPGALLGLLLRRGLSGAPMTRGAIWLVIASAVGVPMLLGALGRPGAWAGLGGALGWLVAVGLGRALLVRTRARALLRLRGALGAWAGGLALCGLFALTPASTAPPVLPVEAPEDEPTDILVLVISGLRPDELGRGDTPAIDALARDGLRFTRAYGHAADGLPALASLLMGAEPSAHGLGVTSDTLAGGAIPLAELLAQGGQSTFAVIAEPALARSAGLRRGFLEVDAPLPGAMLGATPSVAPLLSWRLLCLLRDRAFGWAADRHRVDAPTIGALAASHIERRAQGRWFGLVQLADLDDGRLLHRPPPSRADALAGRAAGLARADSVVSALVAQLRERGAYDRAAIVLLAPYASEAEERSGVAPPLREDRLHVPLIVKLPTGRWAGSEVPWVARLIDVAPTLARLAGMDAPPRWRGRDLFGLPEIEALDRIGLGQPPSDVPARVVLAESGPGDAAARAVRVEGTWLFVEPGSADVLPPPDEAGRAAARGGAGGAALASRLWEEVADARARANAPPPP